MLFSLWVFKFQNIKYEILKAHHGDKPPNQETSKTLFKLNYIPIKKYNPT